MDCGPTCLRMIGKHYGKNLNLQRIREISGINREGVSLLGISDAAEKLGFRTLGSRMDLLILKKTDLPVILHWDQNHFVILYRIKKEVYYIADPARGLVEYSRSEFTSHWLPGQNNSNGIGIVLSLSPSPDFFDNPEDNISKLNLSYIFGYLFQYKSLLIQLILGVAIGTVLQLILPFLTQSIVDVGINTRDLGFIHIILIAQLMLLAGRLTVDFIRSWILLHISTRINISILTDFLIKLMKLPMSFFDVKMTGDIMQRINDQKRIETFLTGTTLNVAFSMFSLIAFSVVLAYYNLNIFLIFISSSILYMLWISIFLKHRRHLDIKKFDFSAKNQSIVVQLISGMQEIKLNNCEQQKRWEWERIQGGLFHFNIKSLALGQYQQAGTFFINEGKNILITFLVAKSVMEGNLTLGAMVAIQYIIGQLNSPLEQMLGFIQQLQDAKISLERLSEVRNMNEEELLGKTYMQELPTKKNIYLKNVSFTYPGAGNTPILSNINLDIPEGKTTAIVGVSGSGKTSILKLLLRFYQPDSGEIKIGSGDLTQISYRYWRSLCGVVMQDGFIFSDTIAKNIAVGDEIPNIEKLRKAISAANIEDMIDNLPLGLSTKIGAEGNGISAGQKQRILIARAVYKDPKFIFFDEATNALDANNEMTIMENLNLFFKGKTVVVVAHRLSTVKHANNIVVMDNGQIIETGTHHELINLKGNYYRLVKNQLELNN